MALSKHADILLVEDDQDLAGLVAHRLEESGYQVRKVSSGLEALQEVERRPPDILVLDIMLPGMDGLEVCRAVRSHHPWMYIIMLTARSSEIDKVVGLEVGADDYVTKPFSLQELVARVRAGLRRLRLAREQSEEEAPVLRYGDLVIDPVRREVFRGETPVYLTVKEFDLLYFLARHPERPFTRMQLLDKVWGIQYEGYERTVDSHIHRLRRKIEDTPDKPRFIRTVWGVGYKFSAKEA